MRQNNAEIIIRLNPISEQNLGDITKLVGLTEARYLIPIIDFLDLEANPRASKTGPVTDAIQESIEKTPDLFPFKTKGILLASSRYERLERGRIRIMPEDREIEGILDGGHNTLAIGLYILQAAMGCENNSLPKGPMTWDAFKQLWQDNRGSVHRYLKAAPESLNFCIPIELLVPRDTASSDCVEAFKSELLEICAARNNNVQLQLSARANQLGYFDKLKELMDAHNPALRNRIEWKTNGGGDIKVQDLISLAWIPLNLITSVRDENGRIIEPVAPPKIYAGKGACLKQFEKLMSSSDVTAATGDDYRRELHNSEVESAFRITVELPSLYDYIYESFPGYYNATGGHYGQITTVKNINENRREKTAPFTGRPIQTLSPDGFIAPLVYGLQALMEPVTKNSRRLIRWKQSPWDFLHQNLEAIIKNYAGILSVCDYDPQKVGKSPQSYTQALSAYKMAVAGIL